MPPTPPVASSSRGTALRRAAIGACVSLLLAGCVAPGLVDERRQDPYAGLLARYEAAERRQEVLAVQVPGEAPVAVALEVLRPRGGATGPVLVLQPGILADAASWRFLMGALAEEREMIAVDPPGAGRSDVPAPGPRGSSTYTPTWLAAHTLAALEALEARRQVRPDYVLLGHSLGGTVVLRALADPGLRARHADLLGRVRGAVLLAPADVAMARRDPALLEIACLGDCEAGLGESLGLMTKSVREGVRDNVVHPRRDALRTDAQRIEALLGTPATRHAMQATLRRFQPTHRDLKVDVERARALADQERAIQMPVLLLWGAQDRTLPLASSEPIRERLATEDLVVIEGAGHSTQQEAVMRVAELVRAFLRERAAPVPAR